MNDPESELALSTELQAELKALEQHHGMSADLITSLTTSKKEARAHISFFKRMMFLSNGAVMTVGLALFGFGMKRLTDGFSALGAICAVVGLLIFLKFATVFVSMTRAIKNTEAVARKFDLI